MNSISILEELYAHLEEIQAQIKQEAADDIQLIASEALEILTNDKIIQNEFKKEFDLLKPLLERVKSVVPKEKMREISPILSYFLRDAISVIMRNYKDILSTKLFSSIFDNGAKEDILEFTGNFLSVLIHEGYSIEGLYGFIPSVFLHKKEDMGFRFRNNLMWAKAILGPNQREYQIIFRMEGIRKELPETIAGFKFKKDTGIVTENENAKILVTPKENVLFGVQSLIGYDERYAAVQSKKELDDILDLLRFDLEANTINVKDEFISIRTSNGRVRVNRLPNRIPNPRRNTSPEDFRQFLLKISEILENGKLSKHSKGRIKSAFHFYRSGRDAEQFQNKFLNWWTALEYLVRSGKSGSILNEIERKLLPILLVGYSIKHLNVYSDALYYCDVKLSDDRRAAYGKDHYKEINQEDFFRLLKDADEFSHIKSQLTRYPALLLYLERFINLTRSPKDLASFFKDHETRVKMHLHRIYRKRNEIIHTAEYSINLTLLSANLEYYLKHLLSAILDGLTYNKEIGSLNELYERIEYSWGCLKTDLSRDSDEYHNRLLHEGPVVAVSCK